MSGAYGMCSITLGHWTVLSRPSPGLVEVRRCRTKDASCLSPIANDQKGCWPICAKVGPALVEVAQIWSTLVRIRPTSTQIRSILGIVLPEPGRTLPTPDPNSGGSDRRSPWVCRRPWGRRRARPLGASVKAVIVAGPTRDGQSFVRVRPSSSSMEAFDAPLPHKRPKVSGFRGGVEGARECHGELRLVVPSRFDRMLVSIRAMSPRFETILPPMGPPTRTGGSPPQAMASPQPTICPNLGQTLPTSDPTPGSTSPFGQGFGARNRPESGQHRLGTDRTWASLTQLGPTMSEIGSDSAEVGPASTKSKRCRPNPLRVQPRLTGFGEVRDEFDLIWPMLGRVRLGCGETLG